jgi:proteasome accessory factor C
VLFRSTYLLSNVRELEVLDEVFDPPAGVEALLADQRRTTTVRMEIPFGAQWAAPMYAERVTTVADGDETVTLDLELLEPVSQRVGLIMLAAGEEVRVISPGGLVASGLDVARQLLDHHRGASAWWS